MNKDIINEFNKLIEQVKYDIDRAATRKESNTNMFRLKQIKKSLEIIKKYPNKINSGQDLKDISGIGKGTMDRIDEIIKNGYLSEIKINRKDKNIIKAVGELEQVIGIGEKTAYKLAKKYNIKNVDELRTAYNSGEIELTDKIILGLKYHGVYQTQIPRSEIDKVNEYLNNMIIKIDAKLKLIICGSYRRQKQVSNDIDVLIYHTDIKTKKDIIDKENYLKKFVSLLSKDKFLLDAIDPDFEVKYMGFSQLKEKNRTFPIRRIDIRYVPYESLYYAMLYFTGPYEFNTKMRSLAEELGYKLSEYNLTKLDDKTIIKSYSEKEIFDKLGMEYITPEKRS